MSVNKNYPKKILIIDNSSWNIYNFRLPLVKALSSSGFSVIVATPVDEYIRYLDSTHFTKHVPLRRLDRNGTNPLNDVRFFLEVARIVRKERTDLIINFTIKPNIYGSLASRLFGIPAIAVLTGLGYSFLHPNGFMKLVPILYKLAFQKIEKVVVYNHEDQKDLTKNGLIAPEKCTVIMGDGIDVQYFKPSNSSTQQIEQASFVFLFIGRLLADKGVCEFVEAAKKLRAQGHQLEAWVLGDLNFGNPADIKKEQLVDWIDQKHVQYLGTVKDIRPILQKAHTLVLPSYREGMPRVILEAMAMGKPIITSTAAGCSETVVDGENGFKVQAKNESELHAAMLKMLNMNRYRLMAMGEKSRQMASTKFNTETILHQYMSLIHATLGVSNSKTAFSSKKEMNNKN